jgi:hypothetical protein
MIGRDQQRHPPLNTERSYKVKHVTFIKQGLLPFDSYGPGATAVFDDAIADMLVRERFAKESKAQVHGTKLVRFLKSDRIDSYGCFARNEIAGFPGPIADQIVARGFATLHDAGNGPGKPLSDDQVGQSHAQEIWELDSAYQRRGGKVEGALNPAAYEVLLAEGVKAKKSIRGALGL